MRQRNRLSVPSKRSLSGLDWFTFFLGDIQTGFGPFISVYLVTQKWNQTDIGIVLSIGALAGLLSQVPAGAIVDAVRSERSAAAAAVTAIGISALVIAVLPIFLAVAAARVLQAMASALLGPAVAAISLGLVGRHAFSTRLGRNSRFASAGNGAAAAIMGAFGHFLTAQSVFFVTAAFSVPALAAVLRIRDSEVNAASAHGGAGDERSAGVVQGLAILFRLRILWIFLAVIVLFHLANSPMLPLAATQLTIKAGSWAVALVAACIVLPQIVVALFSPWVGRVARTAGRRPLLLAALGALALRGLLFVFFTGPSSIVAVQLLDGVSAAVLGVLVPLVIADISYGTGHFNLAQGVVGMAVGLAAAVSTTAAGYVADHFGQHAAFLSLACAAGCGFLLLALLMPETRPANE